MAKYEGDTFLWYSCICIKNFPLSPQPQKKEVRFELLFLFLSLIDKNTTKPYA